MWIRVPISSMCVGFGAVRKVEVGTCGVTHHAEIYEIGELSRAYTVIYTCNEHVHYTNATSASNPERAHPPTYQPIYCVEELCTVVEFIVIDPQRLHLP